MGQRRTPRAFGNVSVKALVQLEVVHAVRFLVQGIDAGRELLQVRALAWRRKLRKQTGCLTLERFTHDIMSLNVAPAWNTHARSRSGSAFKQTFQLKPQERLRNRQETHSEFRRNPSSRNHVAQRQITLKNSSANAFVSFRRQRRRFFRFLHPAMIRKSTASSKCLILNTARKASMPLEARCIAQQSSASSAE